MYLNLRYLDSRELNFECSKSRKSKLDLKAIEKLNLEAYYELQIGATN